MDDNTPIGNSDWIEQYGLDPKLKTEVDTPRCEFVGCDTPASQWFRVICCKSVYFMCEEHVNKILYMIKSLPTGKGFACKYCKLVWDNLDFIEVPRPLSLDGNSD